MKQQQSLDQASMVASEQFRKIQTTAQQALAQCMELGLHVLPIQRPEERDYLASKLLQAAFLGLQNASEGRDLGGGLPDFVTLAQMVAQDLLGSESAQENAPAEAPTAEVQPQSLAPAVQQSEPSVKLEPQPEAASLHSEGANGSAEPCAVDSSNGRGAIPSDAQDCLQRGGAEASPGKDSCRKRPGDGGIEEPRKRREVAVGEPSHAAEEVSPPAGAGTSGQEDGAEGHSNGEVHAAAEQPQGVAAMVTVEQAKLAALAKLEAINAQLSQGGVAGGGGSLSDALAAKFAAANAGFLQASPPHAAPAAATPAVGSRAALPRPNVAPANAGVDAARLAALNAKLAQFQQPAPGLDSGVAAALDGKLMRYGGGRVAPSQANGHLPAMHPMPAGPAYPSARTSVPGSGMMTSSSPMWQPAGAAAVGQASNSWPGARQSGGIGTSQAAAAMGQANTWPGQPGRALPMGSMGPLQAGIPSGATPHAASLPLASWPAQGAPVAGRSMGQSSDVKARLQQEALARLQQVNQAWKRP